MEPTENIPKTDPMRGKSSFGWLDRALDPTSKTTEENESVKTMTFGPEQDGKFILAPSIRQETTPEGEKHLVKLEDQDVYDRAFVEDDYLLFDTQEEADQYSKQLSDTIDQLRRDHSYKQQLSQQERDKQEISLTSALLPDEVSVNYNGLATVMTNLASHPTASYKSIENFLNARDSKTIGFDPETGQFAGMDLTREFPLLKMSGDGSKPVLSKDNSTLLKQIEQRFPVSNSTPGAELLKEYLREEINEKKRPLLLPQESPLVSNFKVAESIKTFVKGSAEESAKVVLDLPAIGGNIGYSAGEAIADAVGLIAYTPIHQVLTIGNKMKGMGQEEAVALADEEATELVQKLFDYGVFAGEKPQPNSMTGQFAAPMGEFGLSIMLGGPMVKWGTKFISKWKPILMHKGNKPLTTGQALQQANKKVKDLLAPVAGGTLLQSPEHRLIPFLEELGASGEWIEFMKDSPDDSTFAKRYKAFIDTSFEATGLNAFMPTLLLMGRVAYNWSKPLTDEAVSKAGDMLKTGSSWWDKIKYLVPKEASERVPHAARKAKQEGKLAEIEIIKERARTEVQQLLKADQDGSLRGIMRSKGYDWDETTKSIVPIKAVVPKQPLKGGTTIDIPGGTREPLTLKDLDIEAKNRKISVKALKKEIAEKAVKDPANFEGTTHEIFNVDRITSDADRKKYFAQATDIFGSLYKQGTKKWDETFEEAEVAERQITAWIGEDNIGSWLKKFADTSTSFPAIMHASRQYLASEFNHFIKASDKINAIRNEGKRDITNKEYAEYFLDLFKYMGAMEADVKIAGNIGRTLQVRNNILGSSEAVLEKIIQGASASGKSGKEHLIEIAENAGEITDPLQAANLLKRKGPLYNIFETIKSGAVNGMISNIMTQSAANLGIMSYAINERFESLFMATMNTISGEFRKRTGKTWLGKGEGMTFGAVNASNFGLSQALLETFAGAHFGKRSPLGSAYRAAKNLQVDSVTKHELSDQLRTTGQSINLPWVGDVALSRGLTAEVFGEYLDTAFMRGDIGSVMKLMVNSAGLIQTAAGRAIVATDGFWRNIIERMELHKLSYIEATNIERKIAEQAGEALDPKKVEETYMYMIRNPDEEILKRARSGAQIGLMQETPNGVLRNVEKYKNETSDFRGAKDWIVTNKDSLAKNVTQSALNIGENVVKGAVNITDNTARTFVASKFSFMRTMTNIYKQYLWERGIPKFLRQLHPENAKRFMSDELYRQETLAKIGSGAMITSMGYTIGSKLDDQGMGGWFIDNVLSIPEKVIEGVTGVELTMEGIDAADPKTRHVKQVEGTRSPEIMYRDENGEEYTMPLDRLDPLKASMALGAIFGSYHDQWEDALALMDDEQLQQESLDRREELKEKFLYALGDWIMDVPMMQGIQESAGNFVPGISPYGPDPQREITKFLNNFVNPWVANYSSLRRAGHKILQPYRTMSSKGEKEMYEKSIPDPQYIDARGGLRDDKRPEMVKKRTFLQKIIDEFIEATEKVALMDRTDIRNPKVGQALYGLVGPEGNLVKYLPDTKVDSIALGLKTLGIPVFGRKQVSTNTSDLILGLEVNYEDPRKWNAGPGVVLTPEQRYSWAVEAGRLNKELFNDSYFSSQVAAINSGVMDLPENRRTKYRLRDLVKSQLIRNKQRALKFLTNPIKYPRNKQLSDQLRHALKQQSLQN
tara:strand:- start:770 stop:5809 length:5040 start_codon:yes stop_codon:yes gene_type:complete